MRYAACLKERLGVQLGTDVEHRVDYEIETERGRT